MEILIQTKLKSIMISLRDDELRAQNYTLLRFWNKDVDDILKEVLEVIILELNISICSRPVISCTI
jgi:very-short-patch-repair endonuclease